MRNERRAGRWIVVAASMVMIAGSSMTLADETEPIESDPAQVLKGPEVDDRDVPGATSAFGESDMKPAAGKEQRVPHRTFMKALRSLQQEDTAEEILATEEQREQIRAIEREFRDARRAYMQEHKDELGESRGRRGSRGGPEGERGERGEPGERGERGQRRGRPDSNGEAEKKGQDLTEEQQAKRDQLKELCANAPQAEAYHARIWATLSAEQQAFVRDEIDTLMAEARERRETKKGKGQKKDKGERKGKRPTDDESDDDSDV